MMNLSIYNILIFLSITWITNGSLNLLYVLKKHVPFVRNTDRPLDLGVCFIDKKRILGNSTTVLGLIVAVILSQVFLITGLYLPFVAIVTPVLVFFGHALGSFIKRRMGKNDVFVPFIDHGDYIIVSGTILYITGYVSITLAFVCLLITYIVHPIVVNISYKLGLKEKPF